jgi:hypothetical protein
MPLRKKKTSSGPKVPGGFSFSMVKKRRRNWRHDYQECVYYEWDTGECCNGVEEGTECLGLYNEECEGYEEGDWLWRNYIELISNDVTEEEIEQQKLKNFIYIMSCKAEDMKWDDKVRYCDGLHPSCCKDCTKSKGHVTARVMEQIENKVR